MRGARTLPLIEREDAVTIRLRLVGQRVRDSYGEDGERG
jgi:hypothetical protein